MPNYSPSVAEDRPKVLLLLREGSSDLEFMLDREVGVMVAMLEAAGITAVTASVSRRSMGRGESRIKPDLRLTDVRMTDYLALLLPSMAVGLMVPVPTQVIEIVRKAAVAKIPIAAQHGAVVVLRKAGVLSKKRYAFERQMFSEGKYAGTGVVRDGNLITSGTCPFLSRETGRPDGTGALVRLLTETIARDNRSS